MNSWLVKTSSNEPMNLSQEILYIFEVVGSCVVAIPSALQLKDLYWPFRWGNHSMAAFAEWRPCRNNRLNQFPWTWIQDWRGLAPERETSNKNGRWNDMNSGVGVHSLRNCRVVNASKPSPPRNMLQSRNIVSITSSQIQYQLAGMIWERNPNRGKIESSSLRHPRSNKP